MAFFDEIKKQMSGMAHSAQKAAEIARLHHAVNLKQNEFDALFAQIGQLYYNCFKLGEQPGEELNNRCARIDALAAEIEGLKLKLDELRQIRRCTQCGTVQNNRSSRFCANCGAKLPEPIIKEEQPVSRPEAAPEEDDFKAAVREELEKDGFRQDAGDGKSVFISWPETEIDDTAATEPEE